MASNPTSTQQLALFQLWLLLTTSAQWNEPQEDGSILPKWAPDGAVPASLQPLYDNGSIQKIFSHLTTTKADFGTDAEPTLWSVLQNTQDTFQKLSKGQLVDAVAAPYDPTDDDCPPGRGEVAGYVPVLSLTLPDQTV